jgi:uncharacterized protein YdhG (YjbR/CyaY superfamily)
MVQSSAKTVDEYLDELPEDRKEAMTRLRKLVKKNLPKGYRETVGYGMIAYDIPLEKFPDTYNGQPLCYIGLASHKNHMALYLLSAYGNPEQETYLKDEFKKAGKKFDMGKSCLRFKKLDDLPLDAIATIVASTPPSELIAKHEAVHAPKRKPAKKK